MFLRKKSLFILMASLFSLGMLTTACGTLESDRKRLEIKNTVQEPVCGQASDCRAIAFGGTDCGYPTAFLLYSVKNTNENQLKPLVLDYNQMIENTPESPFAGDRPAICMNVDKPDAFSCQAQKCLPTCKKGKCKNIKTKDSL